MHVFKHGNPVKDRCRLTPTVRRTEIIWTVKCSQATGSKKDLGRHYSLEDAKPGYSFENNVIGYFGKKCGTNNTDISCRPPFYLAVRQSIPITAQFHMAFTKTEQMARMRALPEINSVS